MKAEDLLNTTAYFMDDTLGRCFEEIEVKELMESYAKQEAIGFADFIHNCATPYQSDKWLMNNLPDGYNQKPLSHEELFNIYKQGE